VTSVQQPATAKHRVLKLLLAFTLVAVGAELFQPRSPWLRFAPPLLIAGGLLWAASLIFLAGVPAGADRRRRFLSAGATVILLLAVILGATLIRLGPTAGFRARNAGLEDGLEAQSFDSELGWAPVGKGRVGERLEVIDPAKDHLLLLGDSIFYGFTLPADQHVGQRLQAKMPHWQVLNGSVSGYSIDQYYLYLQRIIDEVKPRVIVVGLFAGNDYQLTGREFSWGSSKPLFAVSDGALVRAGEGGRCIEDLSRSLLFRTLWRDRDLALRMINTLCAPRELKRGELDAVVARLFQEIEALAQRHQAKVIFELLPTRGDLSLYDGDEYLYTGKYRDLRRLLRAGKHDVHEPFPAIAAASKQSSDPVYLPDNGHFTARGHEILATDLRDQLMTRGLVP
jgi:lysophospholipase L1-like esterase